MDIQEMLTDTICSVFPSVYTADVKDYTNRELFAGKYDVEYYKKIVKPQGIQGLLSQ